MVDNHIEITQVTVAGLVIIDFEALNNEEGIYRFLRKVKTLITSGSPQDATVSLDIQSDRISVIRGPDGHTSIKRDFPASHDDLDRLAEIAELAIANTQTDRQSHTIEFSVNAYCTLRSDLSASQYLANRFFDVRELASAGFRDFASESWEFRFSDDTRKWWITVKRLENAFDEPNLFVTLNSAFENQLLPDKDTIKKGLVETWDGIPRFIEKLERTA